MADYLNPQSRFNESSFNDDDFFISIMEFLTENGIQIDDFKGNVSSSAYPEDGDFDVNATFSWVVYPEDTPKPEFKKVARKVEKLLKFQFKNAEWFECDCYRYNDSEYTEFGYDVDLKVRVTFKYGN